MVVTPTPSCFRKLQYSRHQAKRMERSHVAAACERCRSGWYTWGRYACLGQDGKHWHVGHRQRLH